MSRTDYILIFSSLGGAVLFVAAVVMLALRAKTYLDKQFSEHRRFIYSQLNLRDRAIMRLEYWAILQGRGTDHPFQPGLDPLGVHMTATAEREVTGGR